VGRNVSKLDLHARVPYCVAHICSVLFLLRFQALFGYWRLYPENLPLFCLFVEAITNLLQALYCIIDPFASQNIFSWQVSRILMFITGPWSLATSLLIALYWAETIAVVIPVRIGFLTRYKAHFIAVLVLLVVVELFASIVHAFWLSFIRIPIIFATSMAAVCLQLFVALLFLCYSKVLKLLRLDVKLIATNKQIHRNRVRKMTKRIFGSGIGMMILIICAAFAGTTLFNTPYGYLFIFAGIYMGLQITSIMQIFAFTKARTKSAIVQPSIISSEMFSVPPSASSRVKDAKPVLPDMTSTVGNS